MSHDLRSPLGAILNYSTILEEDFGARLQDDGLRMARCDPREREFGVVAARPAHAVRVGGARAQRPSAHRHDRARARRQAEVVATGPDAGNVASSCGIFHRRVAARGPAALRVPEPVQQRDQVHARPRRAPRPGARRSRRAQNTYSVSDNGDEASTLLRETMFEPFNGCRERSTSRARASASPSSPRSSATTVDACGATATARTARASASPYRGTGSNGTGSNEHATPHGEGDGPTLNRTVVRMKYVETSSRIFPFALPNRHGLTASADSIAHVLPKLWAHLLAQCRG